MEQALSAVPTDQRGVDLCFYRWLSGITDERDQPLNGCRAHVLFLYIDRGQRGFKDRRKRNIIEADDCNILRDAVTGFFYCLDRSDGDQVIVGKIAAGQFFLCFD